MQIKAIEKINDAAMAQFKTIVRDGVTEKEIADQMLGIYQSLGATDHSFPADRLLWKPCLGSAPNEPDEPRPEKRVTSSSLMWLRLLRTTALT